MKMKIRGITLAAALLSASTLASAQESSVGDLPGYGEDAYFATDATYPATAAPQTAPAPAPTATAPAPTVAPIQASYAGPMTAPAPFAPISAGHLQPAAFHAGSSCASGNCAPSYAPSSGCCESSYCDGGCDGCGGGSSCCLSSMFGSSSDGECWGQFEALLWWSSAQELPPLVTVAPAGTTPQLPIGQTVFGGETDRDMTAGFRLDAGKFLTDNFGFGGRFWMLGDNEETFGVADDGTNFSIGRPFFDSDTGVEDAILIAFQPLGLSGSVNARTSLEMWAAEAYGRTKFSETNNSRLDFVSGYSHFEIDDNLYISSERSDGNTSRVFNDQFRTSNEFNGGQFGFEMISTRGRWMARSLTKVHLGNMSQQATIWGNTVDSVVPPPVVPPVTTNGGALALGNQGRASRDVFTFVPEMNFKLAYRFRDNVLLGAGYSFLYFDNVMLNGDVIDRVVDRTQLGTGVFANRPEFQFADSGMWVQGLDLSIIIDL